jgi:hypothetical protein
MKSVADEVIAAVMDMVDSYELFSPIKRGALGTAEGISCETAAPSVETVFLDKNAYIFADLTFNAKSANLETLSDHLGEVTDRLTREKEYPFGNGWEIVDITHGAPPIPKVIGRSEENMWIMVCAVVVKYYRKDDERI